VAQSAMDPRPHLPHAGEVALVERVRLLLELLGDDLQKAPTIVCECSSARRREYQWKRPEETFTSTKCAATRPAS
jgi:hypothetical protein